MLRKLYSLLSFNKQPHVSSLSRVIIDNAFATIILINGKGRIIEWNPQAEFLFGWTKGEAVDSKITDIIIPSRYHSKHDLGLKQFLHEGSNDFLGREVIVNAKHKEGYEFKVAVRLNHIVSGGENIFIALISDQSMKQKIQEEQFKYASELNGRIKNIMTVIQSMIKQTLVTADPEEVGSLLARMFSMDKAVNLLYQTHWRAANLYSLIYDTTYVYGNHKQITLNGDNNFELCGNHAISFALIIHELSTNSIKYGALCKGYKGQVTISWEVKDSSLIWHWIESGGPKVVPPEDIGFGMQFVKRAFSGQGTTIIEYLPEGLSCTIVLRLDDKVA